MATKKTNTTEPVTKVTTEQKEDLEGVVAPGATDDVSEDSSNGKKKERKMVGTLDAEARFEFEASPFDSFGQTTRVTNQQICEIIKTKFRKVFHDLKGVMIHFNGNQFITEFYFEDNADPLREGEIKNIVNLTVGNTRNDRSFLAGQQRIYNKLNGKLYTISDETRLLMSDFMYGGRHANPVNDRKKWDQNIHPIDLSIKQGYGQHPFYPGNAHQVFVQVTGLDLRRLLRGVVYGDTMVTSTRYDQATNSMVNTTSKAFYEARYIKPLPGVNELFVMNIEQFDKDAVERITAFENPMIYAAPNGVRFF